MKKNLLVLIVMVSSIQISFAGKSVSSTIKVKEGTPEGMVKEQCRDILEAECAKLKSSLDRGSLNIRPITKTSRSAPDRSYTCLGICK